MDHQNSPSPFCNDKPMNRMRPTYSHQKHLSCNLWSISQNVWDWLLFTEECLCSSKMENYFITWETWWKVKLPAKKADKTKIWKCSSAWKSHLCIEEYVRMREISHCDVISEMCASKVIFRWKLNCKRQSWISLTLPFQLTVRESEVWLDFKLTSLLCINIYR